MSASSTSAARIASLETALQEVLATQQTLQTENATLQDQINTINHTQQDDQTPTPTITRSGEPKVAQPEYFAGQRNKLSNFITQVQMVITLQPNRYPTELSKVLYAGSFLRNTAFLWFQPYVASPPDYAFMQDFAEFCKELRKTFGDPDEEGTAERQLYALKQRTSVAAYIADFMRYSVVVKWNDQAKAAQFYRGLKDNVKDEIARVGRPKSFGDLQDTAIRIDTRLFERQVERGGDRYQLSSTPRFVPRNNTVQTYTKTERSSTRPLEHLHAAFQPRVGSTRKGRLTPSEYQRRKDNNLCLYCAEKGHSVKDCPIAPARPTPQAGKA